MLTKVCFSVLLLAIARSEALKCFSCDGKCDCVAPLEELCPERSHCYSMKGMGDGIIYKKGCAESCHQVNIYSTMCSLCRGPLCNTETNLVPVNVAKECPLEPKDSIGQNIDKPDTDQKESNPPDFDSEIGQNVVDERQQPAVPARDQGIGQNVQPGVQYGPAPSVIGQELDTRSGVGQGANVQTSSKSSVSVSVFISSTLLIIAALFL